MLPHFKGLWHHPDFLKLWSAQTISVFGSQVTLLALPLTAVLVLNASPAEMGLLGALEFAPFLFLSLFAGVWVDRLPRRPLLIAADLGRALVIGSVPLAALFNFLSMPYLYLVGVLVGVLTVFFDVAYQSYLPALVDRSQLVEGNGKLEVSNSLAQITGPGLGGSLVQLLTAPLAMFFDALSFLLSAFCLGLIRQQEARPAPRPSGKNIWKEIGEGLGVVLGSRVLRSIAACTGTTNLFGNVIAAVFTLYVVKELKIEPAGLGLVYGLGSLGALLGALAAGRAARAFGLGRTIVASAAFFGAGNILFLLAPGLPGLAMPLLVGGYFLTSLVGPVYNINQVSLRQSITPQHLQGRMNASMRFIVWGTMPIGSILGGLLGEGLGLWITLLIGTVGKFLAFLWVYFSPVRKLQSESEQAQPDLAGTAA